jgi:peptidyl-tRNA hydrolase ICT1
MELGADDVDFAFARSSGSGGQNVNKVSTKVDMRLDLGKASWIPLEIREQIRVMVSERQGQKRWRLRGGRTH